MTNTSKRDEGGMAIGLDLPDIGRFVRFNRCRDPNTGELFIMCVFGDERNGHFGNSPITAQQIDNLIAGLQQAKDFLSEESPRARGEVK